MTIQKQQNIRGIRKAQFAELFNLQHTMFKLQSASPRCAPQAEQMSALRGSAVLGFEIFCWKSFECCCAAEFRKVIGHLISGHTPNEGGEYAVYWSASKQTFLRVHERDTQHTEMPSRGLLGSTGQLPKSYSQCGVNRVSS